MKKVALWVVIFLCLPALVFVRTARAAGIAALSGDHSGMICQASDDGTDDGGDQYEDPDEGDGSDDGTYDSGDDDGSDLDMDDDYGDDAEE